MDIKQEDITALHDLNLDEKRLMKDMSEIAEIRPVSVILPMLYSEVKSEALVNISRELSKCTYLKEIIIALAAKDEKEFNHVKRFFSQLEIPKLVMWCNGSKIENLLTSLMRLNYKFSQFEALERTLLPAPGLGIIILTTNQGIMTMQEAEEKKIGRMTLCYIY